MPTVNLDWTSPKAVRAGEIARMLIAARMDLEGQLIPNVTNQFGPETLFNQTLGEVFTEVLQDRELLMYTVGSLTAHAYWLALLYTRQQPEDLPLSVTDVLEQMATLNDGKGFVV